MRIRYRRRSQSDALAQARIERAEAAGIPIRTDADARQPFDIDLRPVGGPWWHCEPRRGYISYRVLDAATGERVLCAPPKSILAAAQERVPRGLSVRALEG